MKTSICFQCKGQALCPTGKVQPREATVSAITACSRFQSKDKQTNADRLRAMTDEEPNEWMDFADIAANVGPWLLIVIALAMIAAAL